MLILLWLVLCHIEQSENTLPTHQLPVIVVPQNLSFGNTNIGYVSSKNVTIYNNADKDIYIAADFDERDVFQPALQRGKNILLQRNEKYELLVKFLPQTTISAQSSFKLYIYTVSNSIPSNIVSVVLSGSGQENPYQLTPFIGVKWPTLVAYTPTINIYNPHNRVLRIKEMYSSGGGLQLVPPFDINEVNTWHIQPYEHKPIMRINLFSEKSYNHLSFVTVRLDEPEHPDIKLPVNVNLVSSAGIFPMPSSIDFGKFSRDSSPKIISIYLLSTYNCSAKLFSITIKDSILHQNGISVKFVRDILHHSHRGMFQKVAEVTIEPSQLPEFVDSGHHKHSGNVTIKFSSFKLPPLDIPFTAHVYQGSLKLSGFGEGFFSGNILPRLYVKNLTFENLYDVPLAIKGMDLEPFEEEFTIENLKLPLVIQPKETVEFAKFSLKRQGARFTKDFVLNVYSNLTDFKYDVRIYNGDVDVFVNNKELNVLNFELLGYNQSRYKIVKLFNKNPVPVQLLYYFTNVPFCDGYYTNLWREESKMLIKHKKEDVIQHQLVVLGPKDYIEINVTITTPSVAHNVSGFFVIETNHDFVQLPLTFRTLEGQLLTPHLDYKQVFPGKTNMFKLMITNTFNESFPLESVEIQSSSIVSHVKNKEKISLKPLASSEVGKIRFSPEKDQEYSYLLTDDVKKQKEFFKGARLNFDQVDYELKLYKHLQGKWNNLKRNNKHRVSIRGSVKSSFADNSPISLDVDLTWPTFVRNYTEFPVTHVKDTSTSTVELLNPSTRPIHLEVFFINFYPHSRALVDILNMRHEAVNLDTTFSLQDTSSDIIDRFISGNEIARKVKSVVLEPQQSKNITVQFSPQFIGPHKNILVIRNNLTLFEPLLFSTMAAKGVLIFDKKHQLLLNIHENLLSECRHAQEGSIDPDYFNVNRSYTLKNVGDITSKITDIQINGISCSAYGISILNCKPFDLGPNESKVLKFNFIPNFHYSFMEFQMTVVPSAGDSLRIPLLTKVPSHMLNLCSEKIARPIWEAPLRVVTSTAVICIIIAVFCQSYIFFSQPIVISQANIKPVIIHKTTELPQATARTTPSTSKRKKSEKLPLQQKISDSTKQSKKKNKEAEKAKKEIKLDSPKAERMIETPVKESPKISKKKISSSSPSPQKETSTAKESPKHEVPTPKPAKITSIVKPHIKETAAIIKEPVLKKQKDVHVVKPELKRTSLNTTPSITESKYRLSNKLRGTVGSASPETPDLKLEQRFAKAVQEEQRKKSSLYSPAPFFQQPSWDRAPVTSKSGVALISQSPSPIAHTSPSAPFQPSVDDWFAPNAQHPFNNFNLMSSTRQTSRFQSLFGGNIDSQLNAAAQEDQESIWGPLRLDQEKHSWKTDE